MHINIMSLYCYKLNATLFGEDCVLIVTWIISNFIPTFCCA